jgi:Ca2+-binding RTX toxin-like protein
MANFTGTPDNDYYVGTAGADEIAGNGGSDYLDAGAGDDVVDGGEGNDYIDGDHGNDVLHGGEGNDLIDDGADSSSEGGPYTNRMYGDGGDDILQVYLPGTMLEHVYLMDGGTGNDRIVFDAWYYTHSLTAVGGDGDDQFSLYGAKSIDVDAGAGNDVIAFNFSQVTTHVVLTLGAGSDLVYIARERFTSNSNPVAIRITDFAAGAGGDRVMTDSFLRLLTGWDTESNPFATGHLAIAQAGANAVLRVDFDGGGDSYQDLVVFEGATASAFELFNLGFAPDGSEPPGVTVDGGTGADTLLGTGHDDILRGNDGDDSIAGNSGEDLLEGGLGNDVLDGGWGSDRLYGGDGDDRMYDINSGNDVFYGGEGNDQITAERNKAAPPSTLLLDGGGGDDTLRNAPYNEVPYRRFVDDVTVLGGTGKDYIYVNSPRTAVIDAGADDDRVSITSLPGSIFTITLGSGADLLSLESSRTAFASITVTDYQLGQTGDRIAIDNLLNVALTGWDPSTNPYEAGYLRLVQRGADAVLQIDNDAGGTAWAFVDLITFSNVSAAGFTSSNLGGYSSIAGSEAGERIEGDEGNNYIRGLGGDDVLVGFGGRDGLIGGEGNDRLEGGQGADRLDGGTGADTMIGGGGDDVYFVDDAGDSIVESDEGDTSDGHYNNETDEVRTALASYTLPLNVARLTGLADSGQILTANAGDNRVAGGAGNDFIYLLGGHDTGNGGAGDDRIEGGEGNDILFGGGGFDVLIGGIGDDLLQSGFLAGAPGGDRLEGGAGNDRLMGHAGDDVMLGGDDNDTITDDVSGADRLEGGAGDDYVGVTRYYGSVQSTSTVLAGDGNDSAAFVIANGETVNVDMGAGNDKLTYYGGNGTINLTLGSGSDLIAFSGYYPVIDPNGRLTVADFQAGAGGDALDMTDFLKAWLTGWDKISNPFATGHLRLVQSGDATLLQADRDGGGDSFVTLATFDNASAAAFTPANLGGYSVPSVSGSGGNDSFRGSAANDRLDGLGGNDMFRLEQGGDDIANGGDGNDVFLFGAAMDGLDAVDGGSGIDQIALQGGVAFTFGTGVVGVESIGLLAGNDTRFGDTAGNLYSYDLTTRDVNVAAGAMLTVDGTKLRAGENLTFNGSAETDGSFFIYGGRGVDTLTGGSKNDTFLFGSDNHFGASDIVNGGAGIDQLALRGSYSLTFGAGQLIGIESIGLLSAQDTRYGALGTSYNYNLTMNDANVAAGVQMVVDGAKLRGGETLVFNGSAESDGSFQIFGGANGDTITGSQNADVLQGNAGADILTGGGGADSFRYKLVTDSSASATDHILDFASGTDRIDLSKIDANSGLAGDQAFTWIGSGAFTNVAGQLRAYQSGNDWFVEGDTNGDGAADLVIQVSVTGGAVSQTDFLP